MTIYAAHEPIGEFLAIDDSPGYWTTYTDGTEGGVWARADGSDQGTWYNDEGTEYTGTWYNSDNTYSGWWVSTEDDNMMKYAAINPVGRFHSIDDVSGYWTTYSEYT